MKRTVFMILLALIIAVTVPPALLAQEPPPLPEEVTPDPWPKTAEVGGAKYVMFQPQLESWDGYNLKARVAVSVQPAGAPEPIFGILEFSANTIVDRIGRTVHLQNFALLKLNFPSAPADSSAYQAGFRVMAPPQGRTISLDRLEAMLAIEDVQKQTREVPVKNDPPTFVFSQVPAILIPVDGEPSWRSVRGTSLERIINSRALVLLDDSTNTFYIHLFDGFVMAKSLSGPWIVAGSVPVAVTQVAAQLSKQNIVDLMAGQPDEKTKKKPSLKKGAPKVIVATVPTELIVTRGTPEWLPITGTMLLYVNNTTGNVFKNLNDQMTYVLVTGRWFRAPDMSGPWQYVAGKDLPTDFAAIPDDSPKENVKASVPGTQQAQEAVIAAGIPHTATVYRDKVSFTPQYNGAPELKPVPDTSLMYVLNSPYPVIMVSPTEWYAVQNGVWFTAASAQGPWSVAMSVPAVVYAIPPSSPLYYVTYVKIYNATPQYVVVGYTPGYMGTVVTSGGVVVYGTGYVYTPYIAAAVWYPPPVTYGYAANVTFTPWTGWVVGFGMGWAVGVSYACAPAPYWGAMPYAYGGYAYGYHGGAAVWGPGGWAATSGNVYQHWGSTSAVSRSSAGYNAWTGNAWSSKVGASYNSTTGRISAGQQASVSNVYNGNYASGQRGATYNPTTGASARGGTVTYGNANTGSQNTAKWGEASGPGGQSYAAAKSGDNYYAGHDGNVYKYNSQTGTAQKYDNGSWNTVQTPTKSGSTGAPSQQSFQAQQAARQQGDAKSAASSWGSSGWGGGFNRSESGSAAQRTGSWGGGGGWDRGGGGGGRSWGGGGWGGGGGRSRGGGGGFRR